MQMAVYALVVSKTVALLALSETSKKLNSAYYGVPKNTTTLEESQKTLPREEKWDICAINPLATSTINRFMRFYINLIFSLLYTELKWVPPKYVQILARELLIISKLEFECNCPKS